MVTLKIFSVQMLKYPYWSKANTHGKRTCTYFRQLALLVSVDDVRVLLELVNHK